MQDCVHVDLGDGVIKLWPTSELVKKEFTVDNDHEKTLITEYHLQGKVVHRSVHTHLKRGIGIEGALGSIG